MSRRLLLASLAALLLAPAAHAQLTTVDVFVEVPADGAPVVAGGGARLALETFEPGERIAWNLTTLKDFVVLEVSFDPGAFDVERREQVVPTLLPAADDYPLFRRFPNPEVWTADAPVRVFHYFEKDGRATLRLGIPAIENATLALTRDVTPPAFTVGAPQDLAAGGFYLETTTQELALADLQRREMGEPEWVRNPTTEYHLLQRFPIQGLDPDTEYETRVVFTDWAGNEATSPVRLVRTPALPPVERPVVTPLAPAPNATAEAGGVVVSARIESSSPVAASGVRVFFDLREVREGIELREGVVSFRPVSPLKSGTHVVAIEATNEAGGTGHARWTFDVAEPLTHATVPAAAAVLAAAGLALAALAARRP